GIHLILGTQKLTSSTLDKVPGGSDLKVNLARMALGNMTQGDRMSAFRNPMEADTIAEPRIGRGLFEPLNAPHPMLMQAWYEDNETLREALTATGIEPMAQERILDPTDPRYEVAPLEDFVDVVEEQVEAAPVVDDLDLDLGAVDLGSLLAGDAQDGSPEPSPPEEAADSGEDPDSASPAPQTTAAPDPSLPAGRLVLSELGEVSWELIEALTTRLADGDIAEVVADLNGMDAESEVGATYRELIADMTGEAGVQLS